MRLPEGEKAVAVNVPPGESNPLLLADDFPYEQLVSREPARATFAAEQRETPEQSRSFWWGLMLAAVGVMIGEIILANRTAL